MNTRDRILAAAAVIALAVPAASMAQSYGGGYAPYPGGGYDRGDGYGNGYGNGYGYGHQGFDGPRGDYGQEYRPRGGVYPQFRAIEAHIQREIGEGVREDMLEPEDARDLMGQLRRIQYEEMREYREHGWNLPGHDQYRLQAELHQLDQRVDEIRDEP